MRRVEKVDYAADPDTTSQFFYDGWEVIEERDDGGALAATYILGPGMDEPVLMNRDSTDYWYMQNPLNGSVVALVDSSGTIQEAYAYRAYGQSTVLTGAGNDTNWFTSDDATATTSAIGNPYRYTARRYDDETGLMYFRMRMYQPDTGSFVSRDPIGYVDGMSLYLGYFAPNGRDPLGLKWDYWDEGNQHLLRWKTEHDETTPIGARLGGGLVKIGGYVLSLNQMTDLLSQQRGADPTNKNWWQAMARKYGRKCEAATQKDYLDYQTPDFNVARAFAEGNMMALGLHLKA